MTLRRFLISIPAILIAAWSALAVSGYGILVRYDPMLLGHLGIVEDAACDYFDGWTIKTVFVRNQPNGAFCARWARMRP
jgi:hypothetical protein